MLTVGFLGVKLQGVAQLVPSTSSYASSQGGGASTAGGVPTTGGAPISGGGKDITKCTWEDIVILSEEKNSCVRKQKKGELFSQVPCSCLVVVEGVLPVDML